MFFHVAMGVSGLALYNLLPNLIRMVCFFSCFVTVWGHLRGFKNEQRIAAKCCLMDGGIGDVKGLFVYRQCVKLATEACVEQRSDV